MHCFRWIKRFAAKAFTQQSVPADFSPFHCLTFCCKLSACYPIDPVTSIEYCRPALCCLARLLPLQPGPIRTHDLYRHPHDHIQRHGAAGLRHCHGPPLAARSRGLEARRFARRIWHSVPMVCVISALQYQSSGVTSLLLATGPALTVCLAHFVLPDELLNRRKAIGVTLALGGALLLARKRRRWLAGCDRSRADRLPACNGGDGFQRGDDHLRPQIPARL